MVRIKNRYFVVNFLYPTAATVPSKTSVPDLIHIHRPTSDLLTPALLVRTIRNAVEKLFGDYGAGAIASSLKVNYLSPATSTAIIRAPRAHYRLVWTALSFMTSLPEPINQTCVVRVVRVSGTIRKAEDEVIRRAKDAISKAHRAVGGGVGIDGVLESLANGDHVDDSHAGSGVEDVDMDDGDEEEEDEDMGEVIERG